MAPENIASTEQSNEATGRGPSVNSGQSRMVVSMGKLPIDDSFCDQIKKSFAFLQPLDAKAACEEMHSTCVERKVKWDERNGLCPILKFGAHAFSSSLVQARIHEAIEDIRDLARQLGIVINMYFTVPADVGTRPGPEGQLYQSPNHPISAVVGRLVRRYIPYVAGQEDNFFHLLDTHQEVNRQWTQGLRKLNAENACDKFRKQDWQTVPSQDEWFVPLAALVAHAVVWSLSAAGTRDKNATTDPNLPLRKNCGTCIGEILVFLGAVEETLKSVRDGICGEHKKAYGKDGILRESSKLTPYHRFNKAAHDLARASKMWDPAPARVRGDGD